MMMMAPRPPASAAEPADPESDPREDASLGACAALLALEPAVCEPSLVRAVIGDCVVKTQQEVAEAFGKSLAHVRNNWSSRGMPGNRGAYPLAEIALWRLRQRHEAEAARRRGRGDIKERMLQTELEKLEEQRDSIRLRNQLERGDLVSRSDVVATVGGLLLIFKRGVQGVPQKLSMVVGPEDAKRIKPRLQALLDKCLQSLASDLRNTLSDFGSDQ